MFDSIILTENKLISRTFHVLDTITEKYSSLHYSKTMLKIPEGRGGGVVSYFGSQTDIRNNNNNDSDDNNNNNNSLNWDN